MPRPDPSRDSSAIVANYIMDRLDSMAADLASLRERESLTIDDLSERYHLSRSSLDRAPWRLPNFGKADTGEFPKRWWLSTVEAWESIPEIDRKSRWELMSAKEKHQVLGVSA